MKKRGRGDFDDRREFPASFGYPQTYNKKPLVMGGVIFNLLNIHIYLFHVFTDTYTLKSEFSQFRFNLFTF